MFGHGYVDLAVSRTTDPNGTWDLYFWAYTDRVPVDPSIGTSTDKLAISSNLSSMTQGEAALGGTCGDPASLTPFGGDLRVASWADAVAHKNSNPARTEFAALLTDSTPRRDPGHSSLAPKPCLKPDAVRRGPGRYERYDTRPGAQRCDRDRLLRTADQDSRRAGHRQLGPDKGLDRGRVRGSVPAHQPGSPATIVNAVDGYAQDALWQAGKLTWATTYPCTPSGDASQRDCVRVTEVDTSLATQVVNPTETQDVVLARNGFDSYQPGIGLSGDGTLDVVYTQSNAAAPTTRRRGSTSEPADPA